MKKLILFMFLILIVSGCTVKEERERFHRDFNRHIECIDGVQYYVFKTKFDYGIAPLFNPDGTVKTCNK